MKHSCLLIAVLLFTLSFLSCGGGGSGTTAEEISKQRAAAVVEQKREREEAFRQLSPKEHLDKARMLLKVDGWSDDGVKHLDAIPTSAPEFTAVKPLRQQYEAAKKKQDAEQKKLDAAAADPAKLDAEASEAIRIAYGKTLENSMLASGYDMYVQAIGPRHTTLYIKWPLISRVWAYQIENNWQDNLRDMRAAGFKKLVITNGLNYDNHSWSWTLQK